LIFWFFFWFFGFDALRSDVQGVWARLAIHLHGIGRARQAANTGPMRRAVQVRSRWNGIFFFRFFQFFSFFFHFISYCKIA
jgi:hypothetical protein